jgi:hypothetical protein
MIDSRQLMKTFSCVDCGLLGCDTVQSCRWLPVFAGGLFLLNVNHLQTVHGATTHNITIHMFSIVKTSGITFSFVLKSILCVKPYKTIYPFTLHFFAHVRKWVYLFVCMYIS